MKEAPHYLKTLGRQVEPAPAPQDAAERRRAMIGAIESSARRTRKAAQTKRRRQRVAVLVAAAAGVLALLLGARQLDVGSTAVGTPQAQAPDSSPAASRPSARSGALAPSPQADDRSVHRAAATLVRGPVQSETRGALRAGSRLGEGRLTVGAPAVFRLASGATVRGREQSRLRVHVDEKASIQSEWIELERGEVALDVPRLGTQQRLFVKTPEALVEVRGTAFRVNRQAIPTQGDITRVEVTEGLVAVQASGKEIFLGPGDTWSSAADTPEPGPTVDGAAAPDPAGSGPARKDASRAQHDSENASSSTHPKPNSNLAEQNRLYQSALVASRNGFAELARQRFEQLLREYPGSPLAPGARRELARLK